MRLIASDLDGTIIGRDGKISSRTVRAFRDAADAGVQIVFVTGRPPRWLTPLREQMEHEGTVICSNGAVLYDLATDRVLSAQTVPHRDLFAAREIILGLHPHVGFAAETIEGFQLEPGFVESGSVELLGGIVPRPLHESLRPGDAVVKFLARGHDLDPDVFLAQVRPAVSHLVEATHSASGVALLEMARPGINKAVTLAHYAASLEIDAADVVAFGDMPNDIEMLEWAGHGYAMASGHPGAIDAARFKAPAFEDDGVAQILEARLALL
ncbi:HAD family hydrolase [Arthrobacter mobilis]|uniref:HAD family hydrolase n=1 Tax=Arthrobacter mobilis TaxID=2724944 RepID=A0A7X6HF99_9MICC|nr:HAD family hydrolase [Arthrobacter mobilis]NKX55139.1 HAD family hydrolase [Arthrobacter mobilis]